MSQKSAKKERKQVAELTNAEQLRIAAESAPAVSQLVSDTNKVIAQMQQNWPMSDKIQFCMWFLGVATPEQMAEEMGLVMVAEAGDDAQQEMDFGGTDETNDTEDEGDVSDTDAEGTAQ